MVRKVKLDEREVYICEVCGFGYEDEKIAETCQRHCLTHKACSLEITSKAVYFPSVS